MSKQTEVDANATRAELVLKQLKSAYASQYFGEDLPEDLLLINAKKILAERYYKFCNVNLNLRDTALLIDLLEGKDEGKKSKSTKKSR